MNENLQINTRVRRLFHYIDDFQKGLIRVPAFQRDFVWNMKGKLDLLDSIKRGYPIGSILFWRPDFKSNNDFLKFESDKIGSYFIPERNSDYFYILDGYQRISTLFGCLVNPDQTILSRDNEEWSKEFNLVYDLKEDKFEYYSKSIYQELHKVPLYKFVDSKEFFGFQKKLFNSQIPPQIAEDYIKKYENLSSRLVDYAIPSIDIIGGSIYEAVDIFSRVNSRGAKISDDWKFSALSFSKEKEFRLGSEIDKLLESLQPHNFHTLKRKTILQCIINSFGEVFFDQSSSGRVEQLARREDFADHTRETFDSIRKTVSFLFNEVFVLNSTLLPYPNQLVFMADFFREVEFPSTIQLNALKKWFWITSYTSYFTVYNLSKQRLAYQKFKLFIDGKTEDPLFTEDSSNLPVAHFPSKISMGSVRSKSLVLFQLMSQDLILNIDSEERMFSIVPLFKYIYNGSINKKSPENSIILLLNKTQKSQTGYPKEMTHLLDYQAGFEYLYFNYDLYNNYRTLRDDDSVLELRKSLIIAAEKEFVQSLGLKYN